MHYREIPIPGTMHDERIEITEEEDRILRYGGTTSKNAVLSNLLLRTKQKYLERINTECAIKLEEYKKSVEET